MTVFLYEALSHEPPADLVGSPGGSSLLTEGRAMCAAIAADLAAAGFAVRQLEDDSPIDRRAVEAEFRRLAAGCDRSLVIAPESDGWLESRGRWVVEAGGRLIGCGPDAVRSAADKLALYHRWKAVGVPTPPTRPAPAVVPGPAVVKPRYGAGSQDTYFVATGESLCTRVESIVQPFVAGVPVGVSFLTGPRDRIALPPFRQCLSDDGRFRYLGGDGPLSPELAGRAVAVAERALAAVPHPWVGWVGVDVVVGAVDLAIEINPRLTTSYVGLRVLCEANLAAALIAVTAGEPCPPLRWRSGPVRFRADGTVV